MILAIASELKLGRHLVQSLFFFFFFLEVFFFKQLFELDELLKA